MEENAVLKQSVFLTFVVCLAISTAGADNLLTNGDFESGTTGWTTWDWGFGFVGTAQDPGIQLDGKYLYAGQSGGSNGDGGGGAYQIFSANPGDTFYISAMAKAEGASPLATLVLVYLDGAQVEITRDEYEMANWAPLADWIFGELHGGPATAGTAYIKAEVANNGGRGTAYFDNVYADFGPLQAGPDYNADGITNYPDFAKLVLDWGESASPYNLAGDGGIDMDDLLAFAVRWLGTEPGYQLVWSDEFDGTSLNTSNWSYQTGDGCPALCGWGNNEWQWYTDDSENLYIDTINGHLVMVARENHLGHDYTSAKIVSHGKQEFLYGKYEARIQLPSTQGIWPAFWMMPADSVYGGWPLSGEIDIMESINIADTIYGVLHFGSTWPNNASSGGSYSDGTDFSLNFHKYTLEWEPDVMRWYVDDILYSTKTSSQWYSDGAPGNDIAPFDQYFYFIFNIAVGGDWPGCPDGTSVFPQQMLIDYVRVYQMNP